MDLGTGLKPDISCASGAEGNFLRFPGFLQGCLDAGRLGEIRSGRNLDFAFPDGPIPPAILSGKVVETGNQVFLPEINDQFVGVIHQGVLEL